MPTGKTGHAEALRLIEEGRMRLFGLSGQEIGTARLMPSAPDYDEADLNPAAHFRRTHTEEETERAFPGSTREPVDHRALLVKLLRHMGTPLFVDEGAKRKMPEFTEADFDELNRLSDEAREATGG